MLRDSLTGLPNRLSFTETIEGRGAAKPATATMPCWWSTCFGSAGINESMGSLAGDELLITFARPADLGAARRRRAGRTGRQ
jgi:GGDEF domain-containing protein